MLLRYVKFRSSSGIDKYNKNFIPEENDKMSTYDDLNSLFPNHYYFYQFGGGDMNSALDLCARLTGDAAHVIERNGAIYFAVTHALGEGISWLKAVDGTPADLSAPE